MPFYRYFYRYCPLYTPRVPRRHPQPGRAPEIARGAPPTNGPRPAFAIHSPVRIHRAKCCTHPRNVHRNHRALFPSTGPIPPLASSLRRPDGQQAREGCAPWLPPLRRDFRVRFVRPHAFIPHIAVMFVLDHPRKGRISIRALQIDLDPFSFAQTAEICRCGCVIPFDHAGQFCYQVRADWLITPKRDVDSLRPP